MSQCLYYGNLIQFIPPTLWFPIGSPQNKASSPDDPCPASRMQTAEVSVADFEYNQLRDKH
jgi:hypothetical protein